MFIVIFSTQIFDNCYTDIKRQCVKYIAVDIKTPTHATKSPQMPGMHVTKSMGSAKITSDAITLADVGRIEPLSLCHGRLAL